MKTTVFLFLLILFTACPCPSDEELNAKNKLSYTLWQQDVGDNTLWLRFDNYFNAYKTEGLKDHDPYDYLWSLLSYEIDESNNVVIYNSTDSNNREIWLSGELKNDTLYLKNDVESYKFVKYIKH